MRHRLIPTEERKVMHREYFVRASIVLLCMLASVMVLGAIALLPADIRAREANGTALQRITDAKSTNDISGLKQAEADLGQSSLLLNALSSDSSGVRFSYVIKGIVETRSPVLLSSLEMNRQGTSTLGITIQGVAPTRDDLLAFKTKLENISLGSVVDLPISTLAKDVNVQFSLKLTENIK